MKGRSARTCRNNTNYSETASPDETLDTTEKMEIPLTPQFSPSQLARMLEDLQKELPSASGKARLELKGFDVKGVTTYEDYCRMRDAIIGKTGNPDTFDEGGRTALNIDAAAIAGAKMVIDNARSTRALSKKLATNSGISEDDILYKGLPAKGYELNAAKNINDLRKASLVESLVDFQKQIQFKTNILQHIDKDAAIKDRKLKLGLSKSDGPITRRGKNENNEENTMKKGRKRTKEMADLVLKTPKQSQELNPLDDKRIYDEYAHNIASELREEHKKRRRTAPIPFNINLLDEEEEK